MKNCCWVTVSASEPGGPVYCGKPTRWVMGRDDDNNRVRVYNHLCPEHRVASDKQEQEDLECAY